MSGPWVTFLFGAPPVVAACLVFSEELFRAWRWLRSCTVGVVREDFMPPYLGLTLPSGRVLRLMPLIDARTRQ